MDECSLPKARPILCNESPAFQRHHMSLFCAAESPNRFPWVINTTFGEKTYIRWCCNDRLSSQRLPEKWALGSGPPCYEELVRGSTYAGLCGLNHASLGLDSQLLRETGVGDETQFGIIRMAALCVAHAPETVRFFQNPWEQAGGAALTR